MKDPDYGYCEEGEIGINLTRIWTELTDEDLFIEEFARTLTHELLHIELGDLDLVDWEEEEVIRAMLGEEWDDKLRKIYGG